MGDIISEEHIYIGGINTPERRNEFIVINDCDEEEGYGVYLTYGFSDTDSFTTSFGYGPLAEIMSEKFFLATVNYLKHKVKPYKMPVDIDDIASETDEWDDGWLKIVHKTDDKGGVCLDDINKDSTHTEGMKEMLEFIAKWSFVKDA
jgi:hypothetical protein